jgi:Mannosyl-glycoprotein endo-beta-N-acetylglucosaminidase
VPTLRSATFVALATALTLALLGIGAPAISAYADTGSSTTTTPDSTTTTTLPVTGATTTTSAAPTTTVPPTTSTTRAPAKKTGVPTVPTGGPPTTQPPPGTPTTVPPPPPDPGPMLTAVQASLDRLNALTSYHRAQQAQAADAKAVTTATAAVASAAKVVDAAKASERKAQSELSYADGQLRNVAIAAYIGVGYSPSPGDGDVSLNPDDLSPDPGASTPAPPSATSQNVSTFGSLTGDDALYASELLTLVGQQVQRDVATAKKVVATSQAQMSRAENGYARAEGALQAAQTTLADSKHDVDVLASEASTGQIAGDPLQQSAAGATAGAAKSSDMAAAPSPTILGPPVLTAAEMAGWFASTGEKANITVPMTELASDYVAQGKATGVRDDIAFAQSIIETGYFSFPSYGQLTPKDNNFAGIGACDSCSHGWSFPDAKTGVGAQLELLEAYASPDPVPTPLVGSVGVGGCCTTWTALGGTWASSPTYGISILTVYEHMLTWAVADRLAGAGLKTG